MNANIIAKTANAVKSYVAQINKAHVFITTELVRPTAPDNHIIAAVYYATQCGITIEWLIKSRKAYKAEGWKGVAKQYVWSSTKSLVVDHCVLRATVELMVANTKAAKAAKEKEDTTTTRYEFHPMLGAIKVVRKTMADLEVSL